MSPEQEYPRFPWRKSSHSGEATNCVEVLVFESLGESDG
ncbi:DUF397 domain-containing protein [Actinoallomurus liliacearum]